MEKFVKACNLEDQRTAVNPKSLNWTLDTKSFSRSVSFEDVSGDLQLKKLLQRAVEQDYASRALIDSIRAAIRR